MCKYNLATYVYACTETHSMLRMYTLYYKCSIEATCSEALHNLALCHKRMGQLPEALDHFTKLHSIIRNSPHVIFQIADMYPHWFHYIIATSYVASNVFKDRYCMEESKGNMCYIYTLEMPEECCSNHSTLALQVVKDLLQGSKEWLCLTVL